MKRTYLSLLALAGLACSSSGHASKGGAGGGNTTVPATVGSGGSGASSDPGPGSGGGGTGTGGTAGAGTGGSRSPGSGGGATGTGGTTHADGGGAGGVTRTGSGGAAGQGAGGRTGSDGGSLNPTGIVTGPAPVDPTAVAAGLPTYYVSNTGDDGQSGTSPQQAWKTITNLPKDKPSAVCFERGGTFTAAGGPALGRNGPAAFNPVKGSVWMAYGDGEKRPILQATEKTAGKATGAVLSPGGNSLLAGLSFTGRANFGLLIETDDNVIQDCEIDGTLEGSLIQLGFSVRGHHNLIVGNHIHSLHEVILDSGDVNTSGGAEAIVINGTDHEIAYNTIEDCWTPNETLGGAEGGCLEVIARSPGEVVENVIFHHNYCTHSVGLFEACAGNFAGTTEKIQEHHATLRNTTLAYNVVVDAMWLYLLQTVNTDMDHLVFEHNTLIHGPGNTDIPQGGAAGFGNFYDTDRWIGGLSPPATACATVADCEGRPTAICLGGNCVYQTKAQPGQIIVRNNLFVVLDGAKAATMKLPPGVDDVLNNVFSPKAPTGVTASAGHVTIVTDPGLVNNTYRIGANSPAVDKGGKDAVKPWPDFDGRTVPCGSAPDVGASEYCP